MKWMRLAVTCLPLFTLWACYGSSGSGHDGEDDASDLQDEDSDADSGAETPLPDIASDLAPDPVNDPFDDPVDDLPVPEGTTIVPEGDENYYELDSGEPVFPLGLVLHMLPAAFSGSVFTVLLVEALGIPEGNRVGAYRLVPGGGTLGTTWIGTAGPDCSASICWSGINFVALFADPTSGIQLFAVNEAGTLVRPVEIVAPIPSGNPNSWTAGDPTHLFCLDDGPVIVDFSAGPEEPDDFYYLLPDGTPEGTRLQAMLPEPTQHDSPTCTTVGHLGACLTGGQPPRFEGSVFFFSRGGEMWQSRGLGATADFGTSCSISAAGNAAAVFWIDASSGYDKEQLGYALVGSDGEILVPPLSTGIMINSAREAMFSASAGSHILVVGPEPQDHEGVRGFHLYLVDLYGNLLDGPVDLDSRVETGEAAAVFWEGDAYAVLWSKLDGIAYRRFRIE